MSIDNLRFKILSSRILLAFIYGVPFGFLTYFASGSSNRSSLLIYLVFGALFGIAMSLVMKKRLTKLLKINTRRKALKKNKYNDIFSKNIQPSSKAEQAEYLSYLKDVEQNLNEATANQSNNLNKLLSYFILLAAFVVTLLSDGLRFLTPIYIMFFVIIGYSELKTYQTKKRLKNAMRASSKK